jgi:Tfp pilus assembly protein PilF/predicted aspartyl protease
MRRRLEWIFLQRLKRTIPILMAIFIVSLGLSDRVFAGECDMKRFLETPMLPTSNYRPLISIGIDGQPRKFLLDTGGFWSLVSPNLLGAYKPGAAPMSGRLGLQGLPLDKSVKIHDVTLGTATLHDVEFYVTPPGYGLEDGTLGANWLDHFDIEIDPVKNTASFFSHDHCDGQAIYWPHQDFAIIPFDFDRRQTKINLRLTLDGKEITAMIDTGAPESTLSRRVAEHDFKLTPDSPGMELAGSSIDDHGRSHPVYRHQFSSLAMGDIAFTNPRITIADIEGEPYDMILGMHQLHALHLFFAYKERKLYVTSAHGDIAARTAAGEQLPTSGGATSDPLARVNARTAREEAYAALRNNDRDTALSKIEAAIVTDPSYSDAYLTRADIRAMRGERDQAFKDFDRALAADPGNLGVYADRALMEWMSGDKAQALADVNLALQHDPTYIRGYEVRSGFESGSGERDKALADAAEIIKIAPAEMKSYEFRAHLYVAAGDYAHAYEDENAARKLNRKSATILNSLCWYGAILGKLDDALDDCDEALDIAPDNATILDSRAFVRFKKGQWDRALTDYDAALKIKPKMSSSLYGRGLVKQQKGDKAGGDADIAAAQKIDPQIAEHFGK